jgi:hypothetical protein
LPQQERVDAPCSATPAAALALQQQFVKVVKQVGPSVVLIRTSEGLGSGNSGGALVDLQGQVVGIPTLAAADPQLGGSAAAAGRCGSLSASTRGEAGRRRLQPAAIGRFRLPGSGKRVLAAMPPDSSRAILGAKGALAHQQQGTRRWTSMRPWTRLQDFGALIAGLYAALSPIWVSTTGERGAYWALIALGVLLAVAALVSLAMPGVVATEWLIVLFGVLLFVAPWVLSYTDRTGASWTSWVVGVIAVILGGTAVPPSLRAHRQAIQH